VKTGSAKRVREALEGLPGGASAWAGAGATLPPADPNASYKDGSTPLTLACRYGGGRDGTEVARLLIAAGANAALPETSLGFRGETPLFLACEVRETDMRAATLLLLTAPAPAPVQWPFVAPPWRHFSKGCSSRKLLLVLCSARLMIAWLD